MLRLMFVLIVGLLAGGRAALAQNAPIAAAGGDQTVECAGPNGTQIQLDGSDSADADGLPLTFTWTSPSFPSGTSLTGPAPTVILPLGTHVITLEVADGVDGADTDELTVTVQDTIPPVLQIGGTPLSLWPPNHIYYSIDVHRFVVAAADSCDAALDRSGARFGVVTSDEPENGTGDGDTPADIRIVHECRRLKLRSERSGNGDGRVYEAEILIEDASGNIRSAVVPVARVFKAPPKPAVDSGDAYLVTSSCEPDGPGLCPLLPDPSCDGLMPRGRAHVVLYAHPRGDRFDRLRFHMAGIGSGAADFGDPTDTTEYQLCVYGREAQDGAAFSLLMNPSAAPGASWLAGRDSFLYRARPGQDDGLNLVVLRAFPGGRGSISVTGSGRDLGMPDLPLDEAAGVEVQLHNSEGQCWGAAFPDALRNTGVLFQAVEY